MAYARETQRRKLLDALRRSGIHDERVLRSIASTPREQFVDATRRELAYTDCALPIGMGQTISQPYIVALMTQALRLSGQERVLEIGTGSGYQTAILAQLAAHVYSVERHQQLAYEAARHLELLGIHNVSLYVGDGTRGWVDAAPYERILVTAAAPAMPLHLLRQLEIGGLLVVPVGSQERQDLLVVQHTLQGPKVRSLGGCVFVPLVGAEGWTG